MPVPQQQLEPPNEYLRRFHEAYAEFAFAAARTIMDKCTICGTGPDKCVGKTADACQLIKQRKAYQLTRKDDLP